MIESQAEIICYGTRRCPDCWRTRWLLDQHQVPYKWTDLSDGTAQTLELEAMRLGLGLDGFLICTVTLSRVSTVTLPLVRRYTWTRTLSC